jgi:hypothetical protein
MGLDVGVSDVLSFREEYFILTGGLCSIFQSDTRNMTSKAIVFLLMVAILALGSKGFTVKRLNNPAFKHRPLVRELHASPPTMVIY